MTNSREQEEREMELELGGSSKSPNVSGSQKNNWRLSWKWTTRVIWDWEEETSSKSGLKQRERINVIHGINIEKFSVEVFWGSVGLFFLLIIFHVRWTSKLNIKKIYLHILKKKKKKANSCTCYNLITIEDILQVK